MMRARMLAIVVGLVPAGCDRKPALAPVVTATARTEAEIATALEPRGWERVVARAQPLFTAGTSTAPVVDPGFDGALEVAYRHSQAWGDRRTLSKDQVVPAPITEFPESGPAIAALVYWAAVGGAVPVANMDSTTSTAPMSLAMVAINTSGADTLDGLLAASTLGRRLLMEGPSMIDAMLGVGILRAALTRATLLHRPLPATMVPPDEVIARVLAAEAVTMRRVLGATLTADGLAEAAATGTPLSDGEAVRTLSMMAARNRRWVMILDGLAAVTTRSEIPTALAEFEIAPDAPGGSDLALETKGYVGKLVALLDDLHAQVPVPPPATP